MNLVEKSLSETLNARIEMDVADIQKLITTLSTKVSDPFRLEENTLCNICTGTVFLETISKEMLEVKKSKGDLL